jgi:hypothetical protein
VPPPQGQGAAGALRKGAIRTARLLSLICCPPVFAGPDKHSPIDRPPSSPTLPARCRWGAAPLAASWYRSPADGTNSTPTYRRQGNCCCHPRAWVQKSQTRKSALPTRNPAPQEDGYPGSLETVVGTLIGAIDRAKAARSPSAAPASAGPFCEACTCWKRRVAMKSRNGVCQMPPCPSMRSSSRRSPGSDGAIHPIQRGGALRLAVVR